MIETSKAVVEIIKANATAVYQDAAQPSVRVVGKSLAQCTSLFVTPLGKMAEIFEKNIHRYLNKLEGLKEEEIVTPDTRILVPVLEKMRFIDEEKVADYYAEILATASKKEHASKVMITFIEILNRLTSDEIKILEYINSPENKAPALDLTEEEKTRYNLPNNIKEFVLGKSLPVIDINVSIEGQTGYKVLMKNFNCLRDRITLSAPGNLGSYIDNMISLGLLERSFSHTFAIGKIYDHLEKHKTIETIIGDLNPKLKLDFTRGRIDTTSLGEKLLILCSPKR